MRDARAVMTDLAASGLSAEQLALVMELTASVAAEARPARDQAAENKRAYDREYQAQRRRDRTTSYESGDGDPAKEIPPDPHKKTTPPVGAKAPTAPRGRADRGSKIPEDWQPPAVSDLSPEAQALARQWSSGSYRAEAEAFRNFWLAETGSNSRKSNWNRAWANRIVAIHGKVMRDAKFGHSPPANDARPSKPMTAAERETMARYHEGRGEFDKAEKLRREATGPPRSLGQLAGSIVARVDHGQA